MKTNKTKLICLIVALIAIMTGVWFIFVRVEVRAYQFVGVVESVNDSNIIVRGLPVGDNISSTDFKEGELVTVLINADTKMIEESGFYKLRPSENDEPVTRENVTRDQKMVSLEEMKKNVEKQAVPILVKITANENIFKNNKFTATKIIYSFDGFNFSTE